MTSWSVFQKGKAELEMENSFLKQRMGVLETTSRSSRSGDDAASADGEARLLGSRSEIACLVARNAGSLVLHVCKYA